MVKCWMAEIGSSRWQKRQVAAGGILAKLELKIIFGKYECFMR